ncbi:MAG: inositol monophosphatase family protein [Mycobacteriales bacterium]
MDQMTPLAALAKRAADAGARAVADVVATGDLQVGTKRDANDLVTAADKAAEVAILEVLAAERPDDAVLGEETGAHDGTSGWRWLVDPIDGTVNFVHGRRDWAVSVGVEHDGAAVAGAVLRPAHGDWVAGEGGEAYGSAGPPAVSGVADLARALLSVGFPHPRDRRALAFTLVQELTPRIRDFRRVGSAACDLVTVATGELDAYLGIGMNPWDISGGHAVVLAAGGRCGYVTTGSGLEVFLAANPALYAELAALLPEL